MTKISEEEQNLIRKFMVFIFFYVEYSNSDQKINFTPIRWFIGRKRGVTVVSTKHELAFRTGIWLGS